MENCKKFDNEFVIGGLYSGKYLFRFMLRNTKFPLFVGFIWTWIFSKSIYANNHIQITQK